MDKPLQQAEPAWEDPRKVLSRYGIHPSRKYSQNFLVTPHTVDAIASALGLQEDQYVVEIGPGAGSLSAALLRRGLRVYAFEYDPRMIAILNQEFASFPLQVKLGDARKLDLQALCLEFEDKINLVGNLPYAITGIFLRRLCEQANYLHQAIVMVQKEVAERMIASPATKNYGALSVFLQRQFDLGCLLRVPAHAFYPKPKVSSAVVSLKPRACVPIPNFDHVVRCVFQKRRKTLRNALDQCLEGLDGHALGPIFAACQLDPQRRGETLSISELEELVSQINRQIEL